MRVLTFLLTNKVSKFSHLRYQLLKKRARGGISFGAGNGVAAWRLTWVSPTSGNEAARPDFSYNRSPIAGKPASTRAWQCVGQIKTRSGCHLTWGCRMAQAYPTLYLSRDLWLATKGSTEPGEVESDLGTL
ncbi:hypothetical protein, partial [Oceanobacter kriegii]|uniref:hypothetical protein n=1 Tax=Oceanobacter kriegii TaxID=64972 RepID=UPI001B7F8C1D